MADFILFWLAKHLLDFALLLLIVVAAMVVMLPTVRRQARCKHDGDVNETSACDAICRKCGKNLGFIGTWRAAALALKEGEPVNNSNEKEKAK